MTAVSPMTDAERQVDAAVDTATDKRRLDDLVRETEQAIERIHAANAAVFADVAASERRASRAAAFEAVQAEVAAAETAMTADSQAKALMAFMQERGLAADLLTAMNAWIRLQAAVAAGPRPPLPAPPRVDVVINDPFEALSAAELGQRLQVVAATVRLREQANELFSVLPPGRERGRVFPAFQAWPEVAGAPLRHVLQALGDVDGSTAWGFFASTSPELEGLTPVEVLNGGLVRNRTISDSAQALLRAGVSVRREAVEGAARAFAADRSA